MIKQQRRKKANYDIIRKNRKEKGWYAHATTKKF